MSFIVPCSTTVPTTDWPNPGSSYVTVSVVKPNGDGSALQSDVKAEHISKELQGQALVHMTDKCKEENTMLLRGTCRPCPNGAQCPGGGTLHI